MTSSDNLYSIIESSFSPRVNPIQEYFKALPAAVLDVPNTHAIHELADCVVVRNPEKWLLYLTKWLVAVVANAMDDRECRNHTCLVLTGEQGRFKTTFLDLLCPPKLHDYSYTGKIYPQEKDTLTYIGQNLINRRPAQGAQQAGRKRAKEPDHLSDGQVPHALRHG